MQTAWCISSVWSVHLLWEPTPKHHISGSPLGLSSRRLGPAYLGSPNTQLIPLETELPHSVTWHFCAHIPISPLPWIQRLLCICHPQGWRYDRASKMTHEETHIWQWLVLGQAQDVSWIWAKVCTPHFLPAPHLGREEWLRSTGSSAGGCQVQMAMLCPTTW